MGDAGADSWSACGEGILRGGSGGARPTQLLMPADPGGVVPLRIEREASGRMTVAQRFKQPLHQDFKLGLETDPVNILGRNQLRSASDATRKEWDLAEQAFQHGARGVLHE